MSSRRINAHWRRASIWLSTSHCTGLVFHIFDWKFWTWYHFLLNRWSKSLKMKNLDQPVQFSIQPPKKFIDYSKSSSNPLESSHSSRKSKRGSTSPRDRRRSRSPRSKKSKKSKHRSRSSSPSQKRTKIRHRHEKRKSDEENDDLYEPDSGENDDIGPWSLKL